MLQKPGTPSSMPTKSTIFNWIKQIVPNINLQSMKVQQLGDGVIYCKIINHYFPNSINLNRLNLNPKNQYEYSLNLKLFQNALTQHKVVIPFDVGKISKQKFLENWGLINCLYRQLANNGDQAAGGDDSRSVSYAGGSKFTPKRSFESAFSNQLQYKLPEINQFVHNNSNPTNNILKPPAYNHSNLPQQTLASHTHLSTGQSNSNNHFNSVTNSNSLLSSSSNTNNYHLNGNHSYNHSQYYQSQPSQAQNSQVPTYGMYQTNNGSLGSHNLNGNNSLNGIYGIGLSNNLYHGNSNNNRNQNLHMYPSLNHNNNINSSNIPQNLNSSQIMQKQLNGLNSYQNQQSSSLSNKCWSVGKLPLRQSLSSSGLLFNIPQQNAGKYSVNSHIFNSNYNAVIDRVKQILIKNTHDIEKIRQIKMLLNIPLNEDIVKIQEQENVITVANGNNTNSANKLKDKLIEENKKNHLANNSLSNSVKVQQNSNNLIETKQSIESPPQSKQSIQQPISKQNIDPSPSNSQKDGVSSSGNNVGSRSLSNCSNGDNSSKVIEVASHKKDGLKMGLHHQLGTQSSGKKIKNNFFGQGTMFRK